MSPTDRFLAYATEDRDRSPHTLARYRAVLRMVPCPEQATRHDVEAWWATRTHLAPATRANELACLRSFYKWAVRFDVREDDPTRRLDPPKIPYRVPRPIGEADLIRLLRLTAEAGQDDVRRAVSLGAYAGLRVAEAAGLTWERIDQDARRLYVIGKGNKERVVGLSPVLLDKLLPETGGNVVTGGAAPYSPATMQRKVNRVIAAAGIDATFHDLRKRGATLAIAKTGDVYGIAKAFGWASVETASHYAVVGDEVLDAIAAAMV